MNEATSAGDSAELEALFDSIAATGEDGGKASSATYPLAGQETMSSGMGPENEAAGEDSQDLQDLFDTVVQEGIWGVEAGSDWPIQMKIFSQVGHLTRRLHDTLGSIGYDKLVETTIGSMPDTRERLTYIAELTERAAGKVLNAIDAAGPLQEELEVSAASLGEKWDALYANQLSVEEFKLLAGETRDFLKSALPQRTEATREQLREIMMAQDFQDLTGQVIKKVLGLAEDIESQLMGILIETIPEEKRTPSVGSLLNGPVINADGRFDVVVGQRQVDDLLDSLGF